MDQTSNYTKASRGAYYNAAIRWLNAGNSDKEVELLVNQFYYGLAAQRDLVDRCRQLNIVP